MVVLASTSCNDNLPLAATASNVEVRSADLRLIRAVTGPSSAGSSPAVPCITRPLTSHSSCVVPDLHALSHASTCSLSDVPERRSHRADVFVPCSVCPMLVALLYLTNHDLMCYRWRCTADGSPSRINSGVRAGESIRWPAPRILSMCSSPVGVHADSSRTVVCRSIGRLEVHDGPLLRC